MMSSIAIGRTARYLLDTNVVSETRKPRANPHVMRFIGSVGSPAIFVSVLTFGELRRGVVQLNQRELRGASRLSHWINELELLFRDRTLPIDIRVAELWGVLSSDRSRPPVDTMLAATAYVHGLTLVTRNTRDVEDLPVALFNPWEI